MKTFLIKKPVITEKSLALANSQNVYTFLVDRNANRKQIKDAIQKLFGVEVNEVNVVMIQRSKKRTGKKRLTMIKARKKKAYVKLKKDHKIDLFDIGAN